MRTRFSAGAGSTGPCSPTRSSSSPGSPPGGVLRLGEAADRLGVSSQAITGGRTRGTILAVQMPNGEWVYPACQFTDEGLVPGLGSFLHEFHDTSHWTQLSVLLAPSARYGGRSALALLLVGEADAARSIAATFGAQG